MTADEPLLNKIPWHLRYTLVKIKNQSLQLLSSTKEIKLKSVDYFQEILVFDRTSLPVKCLLTHSLLFCAPEMCKILCCLPCDNKPKVHSSSLTLLLHSAKLEGSQEVEMTFKYPVQLYLFWLGWL